MKIMRELNDEGLTVVLITHFMEETTGCDRIVIMDSGRIAVQGTPAEVFSHTDEIEALGLRLPFSVNIAARLRECGVDVPHGMLRRDELADWVAAQKQHCMQQPRHCERSEAIQGKGFRDDTGLLRRCTPRNDDVDGFICVEGLTHIYNKGLAYETTALDDISFSVGKGEFVGIIGHTGSGKSTLIQHLNGILKPTSGTISVGGVDITAKGIKMTDIRRKVGLVFQYPEYQLFEETVYKDVSFGPKNLGLTEDEISERVRESIALVGLDFDEISERSPFELSGGQKRRVAIAGVIAMRPEVLILDEPTAGLDPMAHAHILSMISEIRRTTGATIILVSHNMGDIAEMADKVLVIDTGRLAIEGAPAEVFSQVTQLKEIGLGLPPAADMALMLGTRGFAMNDEVITDAELVSGITSGLGVSV
jgi:energy-coupling factor transport system ATP-binding protein